MFYQCQNCKKTWQYPLKKCPDCFLELKRMKSEKIKVVGISKTNIPTIYHPETPYFVLVLEDDNGNRWTHKSIKEYKIGDEFALKTVKDKNAVAVWRTKYDNLETIEKLVYLLGGIKIDESSKILILPTLLSPKHPYLAQNTSPQFLESMIKYLLQNNADSKNIKVASQSFGNFAIEASAQKSRLLQVCLESKVNVVDLSKTNFAKKEKNNILFEISEQAFNNDIVINLPIMKLDPKVKIRGAAENVLKFLKKESYLSLKYLHDYQKLIAEIHGILPDYLTIAEAETIQKTTGHTALLNLALASFNSFNLDRIFAEITMIENLPERFKSIKIQDIQIVGRQIKELKYDAERF